MASTALQSVICGVTLLLISVVAFSIRLFSVVKYESVIHEFDPYFNFRVTKYLAEEGFYGLFNWFDDRTWYPLGRVIGGTMYPGLIWTAGFIWKVLHSLNIPVDVQEVCVFTAPLFSGLCSLATFGFVREIKGTGAGLSAAAFIAMVPSYISRSVAGSFDLEGVAIFALIFVFYMFVKTLNTGSLLWATALCCAYFYMVMSWGGYTFIINLLPIHCLVMIFTGRLSARLYIAYAPLIVLGTLMAASIPVVGFNAVLMSEHFGAFLAFTVLHVALVIDAMRRILSAKAYQSARLLLLSSLAVVGGIVGVGIVGFVMASPTFGWSGRSLTLLDPTYASKYIPIVASVSEHQPPAWNSYFTDLHVLTLLVPTGLVACFRPLTDASLFLVLYGVTAVYFSGIMVRLMLVLAPAACCLGGIAVSECLTAFAAALKDSPDSAADSPAAGAAATASKAAKPKKQGKKDGGEGASARDARLPLPRGVALCGLIVLGGMLAVYSFHCVFVSAEMYSAPSIVLQSRSSNGDLVVFDDFREAYAWLRHNTHPDCKVASWWDYGYQTTAMADRTVIVDNNTWNNTHIATVGRAMSSPEKKAWKIYRSLDVEYVFVIFGGMVGYPSDDINKFLPHPWDVTCGSPQDQPKLVFRTCKVRIGGGVFPEIRERDYLGPSGYRIDSTASKTMLDSLMYKLSYYRFAEASAAQLGQRGFDRVRNSQIGRMDVKLKYFEEVFTSEHWMVRVYRVLDKPVLDQRLPNPHRSKASRRRSRSKSRAVSGQLA